MSSFLLLLLSLRARKQVVTTTVQPSFFFDLLRFLFLCPLLGKKEGKRLFVLKIREKDDGDDDVFSRRLNRFASSKKKSFEQPLSFSLSAAMMVLTNDDEMRSEEKEKKREEAYKECFL